MSIEEVAKEINKKINILIGKHIPTDSEIIRLVLKANPKLNREEVKDLIHLYYKNKTCDTWPSVKDYLKKQKMTITY